MYSNRRVVTISLPDTIGHELRANDQQSSSAHRPSPSGRAYFLVTGAAETFDLTAISLTASRLVRITVSDPNTWLTRL
ncbi:MAG: hypothetical protein HKN43_06050 [Rhodothermales bacterium]|nr:hypothetical protein [Rhodothermales bacterium]